MQYRRLGRTNVHVSVLGMGAGYLSVIDLELGTALFKRAMAAGINYFDGRYGDSNRKLAPLIRERRGEVIITSKTVDRTADGARRRVEEDLRDLDTDYIDLYQVKAHNPELLDAYLAPGGTVEGLERARGEWPWMGPMFAWGLLPDEAAGVPPGRSLLEADGLSRPVFGALVDFAASGAATEAPTGYVPLGAQAVAFSPSWTEQELNGPSYLDPMVRTTSEPGERVTYRFRGSGLIVYLRLGPQAGPVDATLDGAPMPGWSADGLEADRAQDLPIALASGLDGEAVHELTLTLAGTGELTVGGAEVTREVPSMLPVVLLGAAGALALFAALREAV